VLVLHAPIWCQSISGNDIHPELPPLSIFRWTSTRLDFSNKILLPQLSANSGVESKIFCTVASSSCFLQNACFATWVHVHVFSSIIYFVTDNKPSRIDIIPPSYLTHCIIPHAVTAHCFFAAVFLVLAFHTAGEVTIQRHTRILLLSFSTRRLPRCDILHTNCNRHYIIKIRV
jgi:hypothetical protein